MPDTPARGADDRVRGADGVGARAGAGGCGRALKVQVARCVERVRCRARLAIELEQQEAAQPGDAQPLPADVLQGMLRDAQVRTWFRELRVPIPGQKMYTVEMAQLRGRGFSNEHLQRWQHLGLPNICSGAGLGPVLGVLVLCWQPFARGGVLECLCG